MKSEMLRDEISGLLENLQEKFEIMEAQQGPIPQIDMDIFIRDIQGLYESTACLNDANKSEKYNKISKEEKQKDFPKEEEVYHVVETPKSNKKFVAKNPEGSERQTPITDMEIEDILREISQTSVSESQELPRESMGSSVEEKGSVRKSVRTGDLFDSLSAKQEIEDLNRKLAEQRGSSTLGERLQQKRLDSLRAVIGLSDKFQFVKELFDGDSKKYEDVIYTLNNFKKLEEAMQYFSTLKYRFNWEDEADTLGKLTKMIEQKYNLKV